MSGRHAGPAGEDDAAALADPAPLLTVVSGNPNAEELAAVTAVLAALEAARLAEDAEQKTPVVVSAWEESRRGLRSPLRVGPGQWGRHAG